MVPIYKTQFRIIFVTLRWFFVDKMNVARAVYRIDRILKFANF